MSGFWKRYVSRDDVMVQRAEARLDDAPALARLLERLPEAEDLRARLVSPFFARAWDTRVRRDHWIQSDGARVTCFTISGVTLAQAAAVRVRWDAMRGRTELTEELLADLVAAQTGTSVTLVV